MRHARAWGPILDAAAAADGCVRAAASVVIIPRIPAKVVAAAFQCVPAEVLLRVDDTPETLKTRLSASPFLDDAHVLNGGNGKRGLSGKKRRRSERFVLSGTSPQVVVSRGASRREREDADGERVISLCA